MFVGFAAEQGPLARMLASMAGIDGPRDALTRYTSPLTGAYYFVPSAPALLAFRKRSQGRLNHDPATRRAGARFPDVQRGSAARAQAPDHRCERRRDATTGARPARAVPRARRFPARQYQHEAL
jgi:hypothetical protein